MIAAKISLGTVQFGLDYGINNKKGQIPEEEVFEILHKAAQSGINILDTAYAYGSSEQVIGKFIKYHGEKFKIISKLPECKPDEVLSIFNSTLQRLGSSRLYGYMFHSFKHYTDNPEIWDILSDLKAKGNIEKIGLSLYYPSELEYIIDKKLPFDLIQVPYNVLDRRFEQYFPILKQMGVEILVRSVFLQGLLFKKPTELDAFFLKLRDKIASIHTLADKHNMPVAALCLNFVVLNEFVDHVIVGVDSMQNLKELIASSVYQNDVLGMMHDLYLLREDDENIILPTKWKVTR